MCLQRESRCFPLNCMKWGRDVLKSRQARLILVVAAAFCVMAALIGIHGTNETIDRTVSVKVYEDNGYSYTSSHITIYGNLKKTLFSTSFVGTFAIEYYEPSCKDGVEARIKWDASDCPLITFFYAGNFLQLDVQTIDIDKNMNSMMIELKDGTLIASENYYIPTKTLYHHKK